MRKTSVYLPEELKQQLADLSTRSGRSEADLIRAAIERLVAVPENPSNPPAPSSAQHPRPALVGVGVGPGDPGLVTDRARDVLGAADRVIVITTDQRSVGRAEMVVRAVAPTSRIHRVPFAIGDDESARHRSMLAVVDVVLGWVDAGELVAVAVIGDPSQWTVFPEVAARVAVIRPGLRITAEPGITSYQAAAAAATQALGATASPLVILHGVDDLAAHLAATDGAVVLYKASTDARTIRAEAAAAGRDGAVIAELSGLPGQRLVPLNEADEGPISYLATVVFPARQAIEIAVDAAADTGTR